MKIIIESEVRVISPDVAEEFLIIVNTVLYCENEEQLRFWVNDAQNRFKNWFFYFGGSHLAIHQKTELSNKIFDRVLLVEF